MVTRNEYLSVLEDQIHQDDVYQAVQEKMDWLSLFNNTRVQIYDFGARYLITMPKPGKDWKPDLHPLNPASGYVRKIPLAFIDIPAIIDKVYDELIPEDRLRGALDNDQRLDDLTTQLKGGMVFQMINDIKDALRKIWTTDNNYWKATWNDVDKKFEAGNLFQCHPNYFKDPDWVLKQVMDTGDEFLEKNTMFQKGFFFDGPVSDADTTAKSRATKEHWNKVPTNTLDEKHIYVIFNNPVLNTLRVGKFSMSPSPAFIKLEDTYGKIIKTKLPNNFQIIMQDHRVSVLRQQDSSFGFYHDLEASN